MAKRPRKKKVAPVLKIWELSIEEIVKVVNHLSENYPDSAQLMTYQKELHRREEGLPIPEVVE